MSSPLTPFRRTALASVALVVPLAVAACGSPVSTEAADPVAPTTVTATATTTVTSTVTPTSSAAPEDASPVVDAGPTPSGAPRTADEPRHPETAPAGGAEQANAARSAQQYLGISGFSRSGLIEQLEFEGYPTAAATAAVDSLGVDWHAQAARSAEQYLGISGFSRSGLIEQLQFDGFSPDQAASGATAAGL